MDCPPHLEPFDKVVQTEGGTVRRLVEKNNTRLVIVTDENVRGDHFWGSVGLLNMKNRTDVRRRMWYRRTVPMPEPTDAGVIGWTEWCWADGELNLTCEVVLDAGESMDLDLYAFILH